MAEIKKKSFNIKALEKRLMLDASLGGLASTVVFAEDTAQSGPNILDSDGVTVTGSTTDFDGTALDISTNGGADDQLSIRNEGGGAGQIGFDGTNITYEGTAIGTLSSNGANGANLTIDLNTNATKAGIDRLIENITYQNNSDNPVQDRTINFSLDGGFLFSENMTVTIVAQNDDPVINTNTGLTADEGSTTTITSAMLGITDPDNTDAEVTLTITSAASNGRIELSSNAGVAISSFTLDDLNSDLVRYVHDAGETVSDSFEFDVDDGTTTLATETFNITINPIDDPLSLDTNNGTQVVAGDSVQIGGTDIPADFGTEILRQSGAGQFGTFENLIDSGSTQMSLIFTTGSTPSNGYPGEVLFETGGSGRGIGLYINDQNQLDFYAGPARTIPRLTSPLTLATDTQYAVVMEIDHDTDEIRMHYAQAGDFSWYEFGRSPEASLGSWTGDNSGGNGSGLGVVGSNSYGGFNGSVSGQTAFQGTIDSDFVITRFPAGATIIENDKLVTSDADTTPDNIIYTITTDATDGELYNNGVLLGLGDTFTQEDLDNAVVTYTHGGGSTTPDSFVFSVSDGTTTITNQTYNITVVNDPPSIDTNAGADVFMGDSVQIGSEVPDKFGTEITRFSGVGDQPNIQGFIDNQDTQFSLVFTTPASTPNSTPGEVLFESGGAGRGIGLYLDSAGRLAWYAGLAQTTPLLTSPDILSTSTQYAVVIEIDSTNNEIRMHYDQAGNFDWFAYGRTAENTLTGFVETDLDGGDNAGLGQQSGSSYGGYNGSISGTTNFQGTIDSDLILTRFPSTVVTNTRLITADPDTSNNDLVYTITTDAADGELYRDGALLSINDTFTQEDLNMGLISYTHGGALDATDSFIFSVTDGTTTITNQTYDIRVDISNDAPVLTVSPLSIAEDAANGDSTGTVVATDPDPGQSVSYSITGGTGAGIFSIDATTGEVSVADNSTLDYETTTSYTLIIRATDDFGTPLFDEETFTVNIQDVYEGTAPTFTGTGPFNVDENSGNNTVVGTVTTTDAEGDNVNYAITGGNANNAFKIDNNGVIRVNGDGKLDFENDASYTLTIRATDNSPLTLSTQTNVTININDLNEVPSLDIETIIEEQNSGVYYSSATGNFYQYVNSNVQYNVADAAAQAATLNGVNGHLVTITSAAENAFVDSIIGNHVWLAANDFAVEGEWRWAAGPESGIQFSQGGNPVNGMYENWYGSEPNTSGHDRAILNTNGTWYDDNNNNSRRYVIEWNNSNYQVINNNEYIIAHTNADASDVALNYSVGFMQSYDDDGDTLEYTIQGGNTDNIFGIDINTGEITIADKTGLDASVTDTYTLTIRAQEQGGGQWVEKDITINFDQRFTIAQNNVLSVDENAQATIVNTDLQVLDNDTAASDLVFTVTANPVNGQIELTTNPGVAITTFTQDDINNNHLIYIHDGTETLSDSFTFDVTDGVETVTGQSFDFTINPVNQGPSIVTNTGATIVEGESLTLTNGMLDGNDNDDANATLLYTASNLTNGHIEVSGVTQNTFTQDDIDNSRVVFVHDGSEGNASFDFSLADGGEDGATPATGTFNLTKTDVNDAPLVTTNTGTTVTEGATTSITTAILNVTDPDDSGTGITYTLSNIQNGLVELTTSPGVPIISFTQDDLDNNRVIFRHDGNEGNAQFDVSVADGGEDGAGSDTATVNLTKLDVNDAPTVLRNLGSSVNQNSIVILKNAVLAAADSDDNAAGITFSVSNLNGGQIEYFSNPHVAITSFTQDDINNSRVVFRHSGPPVPASFDFVIADGGEDGAGTASGTFNLTVDNTNDAPTISTNSAPTMDEGATLTLSTAMLDSFDPDDFGTGLTWTASNLSNGILQVGGVAQNTFTQADLDNGIVTFIHDNSETTTAGFDIQVADGGEDSAAPDTGTFSINVTPVNEGPTLIVNDGDPNVLNLNDYTFNSYSASPGQDQGGTLTISPDGSTVTFTDANMWKEIATPYTLTTNTVLSFEFFADAALEIQGIGFENGNGDFNFLGYELLGSQNWNLNDSYRGYQVGDGWVRYDITIGQDFVSGTDLERIIFTIDNDTNDTGSTSFRNINFYESDQIVSMNEGGNFNITSAHINSSDVDDGPAELTFTASNLSNGHIEVSGVTQNTFTQADINAGNVVFIHDGSDTLTAGFDISLADGGEDGTSAATDTFTIIVNADDDAPLAATNNGMSADEGTTTTLTAAMLNTSDSDTEPRNVVFNVTGALSNGRLDLSTNPGNSISSFTLADIQNGIVRYVHNGSETISDSFDFTVSDGTTTLAADTFNITITPVNDAVVLATNTGANITESNVVTITNALLNVTDADDAASGITYTITDTQNGWVELTTTSGYPVTSFTQDDIDNNRVIFRHDGSGAGTAAFDFSVADGGEDGAAAASATFALNVDTPLNEGPVIAVSDGAPTTIDFTAVTISPYDAGGAGDGQGSTTTDFQVSSDGSVLTLYGNAWKKISLPMTLTADTVLTFDFRSTREGEIHGIGFDNNDSITDGVSAYTFFGSDSSNALFDDSYASYSLGDGWTRYEIPVGADFTGAVSDLFFMADDDGSADAVSQFRNVSVYEADPALSINEGGSLTITNNNLNAFDTDDAPGDLTYTASNLVNGHIEVNGVTQNTFTQDDINNNRVVFMHDDSETTTAGFDISLADGGENGASADTASISLTVTPVNEGPSITGDLTLAVNEGTSVTLTTTDLGFTDPDDNAAGVTYTASNITNGHIEVSGTPQNTFTAQDIIDGNVAFIHDGSETTSAGFDISLADGGENGTSAVTASVSITVTPVNDAPDDITLSNANIHESETLGTVIGTLSTIDVDLPGDSFTYSIVNDPDNKFIIVGNELRLNNLVDYEINTQHGVTIRSDDGNGGTFDKLFSINIDDNTAPTDILIDGDSIRENTALGKTVGILSAIDADANEVMTYTLLDNPGNMFAINGDELYVAGAIDFEAFREAELIIQVEDIDGNTFNRMILITIEDVAEFTGDIVAQDTGDLNRADRQNSAQNGFGLIATNKREIFRVGDIVEPLIKFVKPGFIGATISGEQDKAFYGDSTQIFRENTTVVVQDLLNTQGNIVIPAALLERLPMQMTEDSNPFMQDENYEQEQQNIEYQTPQEKLRATLMKLQALGDENTATEEENDFASLDKDFDNILRYHEEKQAALREALLKS
ncbi:MAG: cadherin-like domain-containing protein [Alphaproteobacteria bacterium]